MKKKVKKKSVHMPQVWELEDPEGAGLSREEVRRGWQNLVDTGKAWRLQGWYGRTASFLLQQGFIKFPKKRTTDFYGNPIPTREEMKKRKKRK